MKIIYTKSSLNYNPLFEVFNGELTTHADSVKRMRAISSSLKDARYTLHQNGVKLPMSALTSVHDARYVEFLRGLSDNLKRNDILFPSVFTDRLPDSENMLAQLGYYCNDTYTPVVKNTFNAAYDSASVAYAASLLVRDGLERDSYALCRPSGHHAGKAKMSGYCFFNNAAIAAHTLSSNGKVAVLDIDFHHGNGTQEIFYDREDVLTISLHANPNWKFPYYSGFANETGRGEGKGMNTNYPLNKGITNDEYHQTLLRAIKRINKFKPSYLVLSLGFDTHEADPIGGFKLTTEYYTQIGRTVRDLRLPTVVIQEGGYNLDTLGNNVLSFLKGFTYSSAV